jgi:hypothetical protein
VYFSPDVVRMIRSRSRRWAGQMVHMGGKRNACGVLFQKPVRKSLLRRLRHGWVDNIKIDFP